MSASERAEAYLRLRAEAELRVALGFPRVKPPRRRGRYVLRRTLRARLLRRHHRVARTTATYSAASAGNVGARVARWAEPVTSGVTRLAKSAAGPLNQISTRVTFRMHRMGWRWMRLMRWRRRRSEEPAAAQACIDRLQAVAAALMGAGAVSDATAMAVISDLTVAMAARSLIDLDQLLDEPGFLPAHASAKAHAVTGAAQCFAIGITADCRIEDKLSRIHLSALVLSSAQATVEISITFPPDLMMRGPHRMHPLMQALDRVTATDDRGGSYRAHFSGGGGGGRWDGRFHLSPVPPTGLRWLDFTVPDANVVRVPLDMPSAPLNTTFTPLPPEEHADRYLDGMTRAMLVSGDDESPEAPLTASTLVEAGVLGPDSAALGRLAAAAAKVGIDLPTPLAGIPPQELPAGWLMLPERPSRVPGPTGIVPFVAELPDLDGARCVLTGLRSEPERATMRMHAEGWPDRHFGWHGRMAEVFRWTARDDVGGWYLAQEAGGSWGGGEADLEFWLAPALNPRAKTLEVILTGPSGEVSVTVPLEWQEGI
jgi:hypothetical protein